MHDSRKDFPMSLYKKKMRQWDNERDGVLRVHHTVLERLFDTDGRPYKPWVLDGEYEVVRN